MKLYREPLHCLPQGLFLHSLICKAFSFYLETPGSWMGRLGGGGCPGETGGAEVVSHMDPALSPGCEAWRKSLSAASLSCVLCRTRAILVPGALGENGPREGAR